MAEHFGHVANTLLVCQNCLMALDCEIPQIAVAAEGVARLVKGLGHGGCGLAGFVGGSNTDGKGAACRIALDEGF
jgi:hypothetical protein